MRKHREQRQRPVLSVYTVKGLALRYKILYGATLPYVTPKYRKEQGHTCGGHLHRLATLQKTTFTAPNYLVQGHCWATFCKRG
ncbi:hypothetical protein FKM82_002025 [Ascaphus truei]